MFEEIRQKLRLLFVGKEGEKPETNEALKPVTKPKAVTKLKITKIESVNDIINLIQQQKEIKGIFESWAKSEGYVKASDVQRAILKTANQLPKLDKLLAGQSEMMSLIKESKRIRKRHKKLPKKRRKEFDKTIIKEFKKKIEEMSTPDKIINCLKQYKRLTWSDLKGKVDVSHTTISKWLKKLVEEGEIQRIEDKASGRVYYGVE